MYFFSTDCALNVASFSLTMRSTFTFFICQKRKKNRPNLGVSEILLSWYILSLKPKGKGD